MHFHFLFQGPIIIHEVYPEGAAWKDGRLKPGDQILEVNNENFRVVTHQKALNALRQTPSKVYKILDIPFVQSNRLRYLIFTIFYLYIFLDF